MIILGIDPSVQATGFGIIEFKEAKTFVLAYGVIKPRRGLPLYRKIHEIHNSVDKIITDYNPDEVAVESLFYAQNIKTALTLGQARGAALVAVAEKDRPLYEYSPLEIKKAVTGYGQAGKEQVITMIKALLQIDDDNMTADEADALAAALCHLNASHINRTVKESSGGKRTVK
ncbi:MAG: crossover junction endodeoxyribonuclease RuvC [Candidatus Aminicenantes bacterium]|nr:crossover junction endodeoxyribonuclease RuvC [Candidatus Aminicenantes bacterium]